MKHVAITEFQKAPKRYLRLKPFVITLYDKPNAMVVPLDWNPNDTDKYDEEGIIKQAIDAELGNLAEGRGKFNINNLLKALEALKDVKRKGELGTIVDEATMELFGEVDTLELEGKIDLKKEEDDEATNPNTSVPSTAGEGAVEKV